MAELLTVQEIGEFYDRLLTKPEYIKTLKKSISEVKREQILDHAERVSREACNQLACKGDFAVPCTDPRYYMTTVVRLGVRGQSIMAVPCSAPETTFVFPPFPNEQEKHFDHTGWSYKDKLQYWYQDAETVKGILNETKPETSDAELALLMFYRGETMENDRSNLYNKFIKYSSKTNRLGAELSGQKYKNKIELFEKVIEKLSGKQKIHAEEDLKVLKINTDYQ